MDNETDGSRVISIHVLRVEDDASTRPPRRRPCDFNPRPPCGGRQHDHRIVGVEVQFQSTSSVWRTTRPGAGLAGRLAISIHVLRVEDDT